MKSPEYLEAIHLAPVLAVVVSGVAAVILARAGCRKLANPQVPLLSKAQALGLFALTAAAFALPALADTPYSPRAAAQEVMVLQIVLLPVITVLGTFATPTFDHWAIALRRGDKLSPFHDNAPPHGLVWSMAGLLMLLACACYWQHGFPHRLQPERLGGLMLWLLMATTLPWLLMFGSTRFTAHRTRVAYVVGVLAHLGFQVLGMVLISEGGIDVFDHIVTKVVAVLALAVPAWVIWRQRVLRARTLSPNR